MLSDQRRGENIIIYKRIFLILLAVGALLLFVVNRLSGTMQTPPQHKPNIVFFLIDDLGWRDLGCYGSSLYETPAIDQLAADGMRFTQAYSAHPRCVPSRFAIMSGRFPARGGVPGQSTELPLEVETIAEALKAGGYKTFFAGKWHLGKKGAYPDNQGFDVNIAGGKAGSPRSYFTPYNVGHKPWHKKKTPIYGLDDAPEGQYLTDRLTNETIGFLKENIHQPFFVMLAHYAVHDPLQARQEMVDRYNAKLKSMPKPRVPEYIKEGAGFTKMRQDNPVYAAMIQSVDESVRRVLATLDELGLTDNTLVVFTSDHGGLSNRGYRQRQLATSNAPLRAGKGWCYEGGIRVPLIVRWAGKIEPKSETGALVSGVDFFPTLLEAADLPLQPEQRLDGVSFYDALSGKRNRARKPMFWHSPKGRPHSTGDVNCSAIREGDYKLIDWYDDGRIELFNIRKDIGEALDLAEAMPEKRDELYRKLEEWRKEVNAYIDPKPAKRTK